VSMEFLIAASQCASSDAEMCPAAKQAPRYVSWPFSSASYPVAPLVLLKSNRA